MKKTIGILLIISLLLSLSTVVNATEGERKIITAEPVVGAVGETVTVELFLDTDARENYNLDSLQFALAYDITALEFVEYLEAEDGIATKGTNLIFANDSKDENNMPRGEFLVAYVGLPGLNQNGLFLRVKFKLITDAGSALVVKNVTYSYYDTSSGENGKGTAITMTHDEPIELGGISVGNATVPTPNASMMATATPVSTANEVVSTSMPTNPGIALSTPLTVETIKPGNDKPNPTGTLVATATPQPDESIQPADSPAGTDDSMPDITADTQATPTIGIVYLTDTPEPQGDEPSYTQEPAEQDGDALFFIIILVILGVALLVIAVVLLIVRKKRG